jgi:hypothetical protein
MSVGEVRAELIDDDYGCRYSISVACVQTARQRPPPFSHACDQQAGDLGIQPLISSENSQRPATPGADRGDEHQTRGQGDE